jgi:hypothetical protein
MTAQTMNGGPARIRTYFGWQQERVAFMFGYTGQRVALLVGAVLAGIWPIAVSRFSLAVISWPIAVVLTGLVFARIGGRTIDEWVTAFVSYQLLRVRQQHKFLSAAFAPAASPETELENVWAGTDPATTTVLTGGPDPDGQRPPRPRRSRPSWTPATSRPVKAMDLPGILAPLTILEADLPGSAAGALQTGPGVLAVAYHRIDRTYTAVAKVRFPGIGLVDSARRETRVSGWGGLLSGLCTEGNLIVRVQALQRISPASGAALRRWHTDHVPSGAPQVAVDIAAGLLGTAGVATSQREAYLSFTMDSRRAASAIRAAGGGSAAAVIVLTRHLRALASSVAGADVQIESWLGPRDLAEVIRTAYDPHSARHLAERRAAADDSDGSLAAGVDPGAAGPSAAEAKPGSYHHDGAQSVSFWVHDWPRNQVYSTALAPLLGESTHRRAFSLHIEPLGPRAAEREVMRERTSRSVAVRMRQRTGQIVPEHEQAALDRARAQDVDRAAGHGLVRFSAYVTVTVTDPADLEDACAELEADAAAARIELRRMWFAQDVGFAMGALPLGFGLPKKRW